MEEVSTSSTAESNFEHEYQQALSAMEADAARSATHCDQDFSLIPCSAERRRQRRERRARRKRHYQHKLKKLRKSVKILLADLRRRSREALIE